jgi:hypothetical protein
MNMYKRVKDKHEDKFKRYREYAEIYVDDIEEALTVDPDDYIQGSKMYIIETAELYVLQANRKQWRSVDDGSPLSEVAT